MTTQMAYRLIILIGLIPTIGIFVWGVRTAVLTSSIDFVVPFEQMK